MPRHLVVWREKIVGAQVGQAGKHGSEHVTFAGIRLDVAAILFLLLNSCIAS